MLLTPRDLRWDVYHRGDGHNAVRVTHLPTGIVAQSELDASILQNKQVAFTRLAGLVIERCNKQELVMVEDEETNMGVRQRRMNTGPHGRPVSPNSSSEA
jgi:protein subunit release factor A